MIDYRLYVITDRTWLGSRTLEEAVTLAIKGGATLVQIREKGISQEEYIRRAIALKEVCDAHGVPMIVNDNTEVALACKAAGVHLGQSDGDVRRARALLGEDAIIGVTAKTPEQAREARAQGADYLGCGALFGSSTKTDAKSISREAFALVAQAADIPVVAIGGITAENAAGLGGIGAAGLCAISSVFAQEDIEGSARRLRRIAEEVCV